MRVKEFTATAVIPTAQYANIQATITVETDGNIEGAKHEALRHIEQISQRYAETGKALPQLHQGEADAQGTPTAPVHRRLVELRSEVTGGTAFFDEIEHVYTNQFGQTLLSGSKFASQFVEEFNPDFIVPKMADKYQVNGQDIKDMWALNAAASCSIGDAIHQAMELYGTYQTIGEAIDAGKADKEKKWSHVHKNPILRAAVERFFGSPAHVDEIAYYEPFIVNNDAMLCGSIDRLLILDLTNKVCRVQDWKTNSDIMKKGSPKYLKAPFAAIENLKINEYWLQLSFYAFVLKLAGWTVEGIDIFHYDGEVWKEYSHDVIDISGAAILQQVKQQ